MQGSLFDAVLLNESASRQGNSSSVFRQSKLQWVREQSMNSKHPLLASTEGAFTKKPQTTDLVLGRVLILFGDYPNGSELWLERAEFDERCPIPGC